MFPHLTNFKLQEWVETHRQEWSQQPGRLKMIWEKSDFIAFLSSEPTTARQFHVNPGDEIFYQLEGRLDLHYISPNGSRELMVVAPGEIFLLPAGVPHSPRRGDPDRSWTLVITRKRGPTEIDRWVWYCERCNNKLHETAFKTAGPSNVGNVHLSESMNALAEAEGRLQSQKQLRTCSKCGEVFPS
jgi:3-hydroxyanthranilate 3,4-dioxygenase